MNPSGQPQNQNNIPPPQPPQPGATPPAPNPYAQPQPQQNFYNQPQQPQQPAGWGQPANHWQQTSPPQPQPQPGIDPQPAGPADYGADYLDTIAPGPGGPRFFSGSFTWIIIGLAVLFMFAVGIIAISNSGNNTTTTETTYQRLDNLVKIADKYKIYLKSSKLSATNSTYKIFMTGAQKNLVGPLTQNGVNMEKMNKTIKSSEKSKANALSAKLEDARLNAILDRVYAREMAHQSQQLLDLYKKMTKNSSKQITDAANTAIPNLEPIQKAFADFNE